MAVVLSESWPFPLSFLRAAEKFPPAPWVWYDVCSAATAAAAAMAGRWRLWRRVGQLSIDCDDQQPSNGYRGREEGGMGERGEGGKELG